MQTLIPQAERLAAMLRERHATLAVAESSAGGLVSAALLAVPGASAYFQGGAVVYTAKARAALLGIDEADMVGMRASSEPYARLLAARIRERFGTVWGLAETGAAGPDGNRYGDPVGHACIAVDGPVRLCRTIATGSGDRADNMRVFAAALLALLEEAISLDAPTAR